jgi:hypothetical protein
MLEAGRGLISGEPIHVGVAFAAVVGMAGVLWLWALRGMRRAEAAGG